METSHTLHLTDARDLESISTGSVELVVTSPPYPMIEMWDDAFASMNTEIEDAIADGNQRIAFDLMHGELAKVWEQLTRIVSSNGIVCINIGDATRKINESFELFPNHARIIEWFTQNEWSVLPSILWRKPTNSAAKFMGSGMIPPNQYVTLEHEHILVFRNGDQPRQVTDDDLKRQSAYFYEERNKWFTDTWNDVKGRQQALTTDNQDTRNRSAAYPFTIPYRLINMYSTYNDTVLDPFLGTGTTTRAAMVAGRNSIGCEIKKPLIDSFKPDTRNLHNQSVNVVSNRIQDHAEHVETVLQDADEDVISDIYGYQANNYPLPVRSKNETGIQFYTVESVTQQSSQPKTYSVHHTPYTVGEDVTTEFSATHNNQTSLTDEF